MQDGSLREMRMNNYDILDREYADFAVLELVPHVIATYGLRISPSPGSVDFAARQRKYAAYYDWRHPKRRTRMDFFELNGLQYLIRYPQGFCKEEHYPVILFLHGAGSRGKDFTDLLENAFFEEIDKQLSFPFVVIAPLCSEDTWFDMFERLKALVLHIKTLSFTDSTCLYVMGASMGGYATWQLAMSMPEHFAAAVPICGGGMYWNASRLRGLAIWAFHGAKDTVVRVEESQKMVARINEKAPGNAKLTIYPENGHNAWSDTYRNPEVFTWLLSHRKQERTAPAEGECNDVKIYG